MHPKESLPTTENSQIVFKESFFQLKRDTLRLSNGHRYAYYTFISKPAAVVIVATTPNHAYLINLEYRHPVGKVLVSFPGGYLNEGEDPLAGAKRELLEETGYSAEHYELIGQAYPYAGISPQLTYYVRATGARQVNSPQMEPAEIIESVLKTKIELQELVKHGAFLDGQLCSALFFAGLS